MGLSALFALPPAMAVADVSARVAAKVFEQARGNISRKLQQQGEPALADAMAALATPERCWRPELGLALAAAARGEAVIAALQLTAAAPAPGLHLHAAVNEDTGLFVAGAWLPLRGHISIDTDATTLEIRSSHGTTTLSHKLGNASHPRGDIRGHWQVCSGSPAPFHYAIDSRLTAATGLFPWPQAKPRTAPPDDAFSAAPTLQRVEQALDLLAAKAPEYRQWLDTIADGLLLTQGSGRGGLTSPEFPGLIAISALTSPLDLLEALVAATCQQKLFQLSLVTALTASQSEEIHYLPTRRSYITTRRCLSAMHEHKNLIRLLSTFREDPEHAELADSRIRRRQLLLQTECAPALARSSSLSAEGRDFLQALSQCADSAEARAA